MSVKPFIVLCLLSLIVFRPNGDEFVWSEGKKLTWEDFKAKPDSHSDAVALTASGITFGYSYKQQRGSGEIISFTTDVNAYFYPSKSWYHKDKANDYILQHEQLHFDITELYVRKFRKEVEHLKLSKHIKTDLKRLQKDINEALSKAQNAYDFDTTHSINKARQQVWIDSIQSELLKLKAYKSH